MPAKWFPDAKMSQLNYYYNYEVVKLIDNSSSMEAMTCNDLKLLLFKLLILHYCKYLIWNEVMVKDMVAKDMVNHVYLLRLQVVWLISNLCTQDCF